MWVYKARVWFRDQLDNWQDPRVEGRGHELQVGHARSKRGAATQDQKEATEANYLGMVEDLDSHKRTELGKRGAQERVAKVWGVPDREECIQGRARLRQWRGRRSRR